MTFQRLCFNFHSKRNLKNSIFIISRIFHMNIERYFGQCFGSDGVVICGWKKFTEEGEQWKFKNSCIFCFCASLFINIFDCSYQICFFFTKPYSSPQPNYPPPLHTVKNFSWPWPCTPPDRKYLILITLITIYW